VSTSNDQSRFPQSFDDVPCVWMTAGVLAYQLCNRSLDCDACPLDLALKKHFYGKSQQSPVETPASVEEVDRLRPDRWYSERYGWVMKTDRGTYRVGIVPPLTRFLLIPKSIVLPSFEQKVMRRQSAVWIVLEQGTFPIAAPLDGEVVARNSGIAEHPSSILQQPFDDGWLYEVTADDSSLGELMDASVAAKQYDNDVEKLNRLLLQALKPASHQLGPTLADGGIVLQHVADMLGYQKYMKIVKSVFG